MLKKLIVIDSGNIMFKAIFAYSAQYKTELKNIMYPGYIEKITEDMVPEVTEEKARKILDGKINNRDIFIMNPKLTYLKMIVGYLKRIGTDFDTKIILAEDYGSWRKEVDPLYKAQRKDYRESKEDADWWARIFKEFNEFIPTLAQSLPWHFVKVYKMEADDIASVAIRYLEAEEKILISSDEDWQMLCVIPNVKVFSPYSKKFKIIKNPEKILQKKIKGDISDNLLVAPANEAEYEKRRTIVDLIHLPLHIEQILRPIVESLPIKSVYLNKIPFKSCQEEIRKLYKLKN